jgi:hypothetical protein
MDRNGLTVAERERGSGGRTFYGEQGEGLGAYFLDSVFADIDSLTLYGGIHTKVFGYHRLLARRFPYAVYYRMDAGGWVIIKRTGLPAPNWF